MSVRGGVRKSALRAADENARATVARAVQPTTTPFRSRWRPCWLIPSTPRAPPLRAHVRRIREGVLSATFLLSFGPKNSNNVALNAKRTPPLARGLGSGAMEVPCA
jgi:hypothetical protein